MKKIVTAAAIAAIMGASSAAIADWDMPFFDDNDSDYYNDNRWYNDGYGYGRGDGSGRGRGRGRGSFNKNFDADADTDWEGDGYGYGDSYYRGYNNWDNRYYGRNYNGPYGYGPAPYGYGPVPYGPAPVAPQAAPQAPGTPNCGQ